MLNQVNNIKEACFFAKKGVFSSYVYVITKLHSLGGVTKNVCSFGHI